MVSFPFLTFSIFYINIQIYIYINITTKTYKTTTLKFEHNQFFFLYGEIGNHYDHNCYPNGVEFTKPACRPDILYFRFHLSWGSDAWSNITFKEE